MFFSFLCFGAIPLLAYLPQKGKGVDIVFAVSCFLTMLSLTVLGAVKGYLIGLNMIRSALMMILNGTISGLVSFTASSLIEKALSKTV